MKCLNRGNASFSACRVDGGRQPYPEVMNMHHIGPEQAAQLDYPSISRPRPGAVQYNPHNATDAVPRCGLIVEHCFPYFHPIRAQKLRLGLHDGIFAPGLSIPIMKKQHSHDVQIRQSGFLQVEFSELNTSSPRICEV